MLLKIKYILYLFLLLSSFFTVAQEADIELGANEIGENQFFTVTITLKNGKITFYDGFPEIPGFRKSGTSSSSQTEFINGRMSSSHSITMNYAPSKQGKFIVKPFKIKVNNDELESKGTTINVGPPIQRSTDPIQNLFDHEPDDFFGRKSPPEYIEIKDDAFLAVSTNKKEVYLGEGFTIDLSFFVSENNRAILQFHDLGKQLSGILKDLRPDNCWEENFNIENISGEEVTFNGNRYTQYKIYEATYFPFNEDTIVFPKVGLEMIKYKMAKNPSFFGRNREEGFKTFYSGVKKIIVKPLPPHPLKDIVAVGKYKLNETLNSAYLETGQSFEYDFTLYGEGNFPSLEKPITPQDGKFDFFDPTVKQKINKRNQKITGSKVFSYYGIPNEPGVYNLGDYFKFIFFNLETENYDTLKSNYKVTVTGESLKNESIQASDLGSFYDIIKDEKNSLNYAGTSGWIKIFANIFILLSVIIAGIFVFKK